MEVTALGGAFMLGTGRDSGFQGGGQLSWRYGRSWGAIIQGSADSSISSAVGPGNVDVHLQAFDLCGELRLHPVDFGSLHLLLGPSLQRISAASHGFTENEEETLYDLGVAAIVQWEHRIVSRLSLVAQIRAGVRVHEDTFTVRSALENWAVLTVAPLRLSASVGLGWQLL